MAILDELGAAGQPVALTDLARRVNMTKSRVWRFLSTMRNLDLVEREDDGERYRLGWKIFRLGQLAADRYSVPETAYPYLVALRDKTGHQCYLSIPTSGGATIISILQPLGGAGLTITSQPGTFLSACDSSAGRLLLAYMPRDQAIDLIRNDQTRKSGDADTLYEQLAPRLEKLRRCYFDTNYNAQDTGAHILSVPVFDHRDAIAAVVSLVIATGDSPETLERDLLNGLKSCARSISSSFGSTRWEADPP